MISFWLLTCWDKTVFKRTFLLITAKWSVDKKVCGSSTCILTLYKLVARTHAFGVSMNHYSYNQYATLHSSPSRYFHYFLQELILLPLFLIRNAPPSDLIYSTFPMPKTDSLTSAILHTSKRYRITYALHICCCFQNMLRNLGWHFMHYSQSVQFLEFDFFEITKQRLICDGANGIQI